MMKKTRQSKLAHVQHEHNQITNFCRPQNERNSRESKSLFQKRNLHIVKRTEHKHTPKFDIHMKQEANGDFDDDVVRKGREVFDNPFDLKLYRCSIPETTMLRSQMKKEGSAREEEETEF